VDHALDTAGIGSGCYKHVDKVRRSAARLITRKTEEVTFIKNTTAGIGWVANGLSWNTGRQRGHRQCRVPRQCSNP
jgi:selenocysteine lyase/cysteine desulfurase